MFGSDGLYHWNLLLNVSCLVACTDRRCLLAEAEASATKVCFQLKIAPPLPAGFLNAARVVWCVCRTSSLGSIFLCLICISVQIFLGETSVLTATEDVMRPTRRPGQTKHTEKRYGL